MEVNSLYLWLIQKKLIERTTGQPVARLPITTLSSLSLLEPFHAWERYPKMMQQWTNRPQIRRIWKQTTAPF